MTQRLLSRLLRPIGSALLLIAFLTGCQQGLFRPETAPTPPQAETAVEPRQEQEKVLLTFPREITLNCPDIDLPAIPPCPVQPRRECPKCPTRLDGKIVVGAVEQVEVEPPGVVYTARIDSGATGTSIHASNIVRFERDGERWVRFDIDNPEGGEPLTLEREVLHRVRIRQAELEGFERRLVVLLNLTMGSITQNVEVSLADRSGMEYPMLVGRDLLRDKAVVDVSQEFIAK